MNNGNDMKEKKGLYINTYTYINQLRSIHIYIFKVIHKHGIENKKKKLENYLVIIFFILVSGEMPSISVSSVAPKRARNLSTLLCNRSISTSYWKRTESRMLVTR